MCVCILVQSALMANTTARATTTASEGDDNGNGYDNDTPSNNGICKTCAKVQVKQEQFEAEARAGRARASQWTPELLDCSIRACPALSWIAQYAQVNELLNSWTRMTPGLLNT